MNNAIFAKTSKLLSWSLQGCYPFSLFAKRSFADTESEVQPLISKHSYFSELLYGLPKSLQILLYLLVSYQVSTAQDIQKLNLDQEAKWSKKDLLFEDNGTEDWTQNWFLDGERAGLDNTPLGMYYSAGPEAKNDTCHAVLWTKQAFEGNLLIEFDYTRADYSHGFVNILYFHATGKGGVDYPEDISQWNEKRRVPSMRTYFRNMNTYHISFATGGADSDEDYIRLRRYDPSKSNRLTGSDIGPDKFNSGLFKPFHTYHIQVAHHGHKTTMHIQNKNDSKDHLTLQWDTSGVPACKEGRIGLRHMYTRAAIYRDFKVWRIE